MCQWFRKFFARMKGLPPRFHLDFTKLDVDVGIPKFHLPAHGRKDQIIYSLNFKEGVGQTDGEGIERNWSKLNSAAASTKQMGPGSRHDTLDDFCGHMNWRKLVNLGASSWFSVLNSNSQPD
jgi:hypothetical protein